MKSIAYHLCKVALLIPFSIFSMVADAQVALNLSAGWNLLGNSSADPIDAATTFSDKQNIKTVWKWNKTTSKWAFYAPSMSGSELSAYALSRGYDTLSSIASKEGFWVNAASAAALSGPTSGGVALTESDLQVGWNLVSSDDGNTPSTLSKCLSSGLKTAGKEIATIWAWNAPTSKWKFYAPSLDALGGAVLSDYANGKGYLQFNEPLSVADGVWLNVSAPTSSDESSSAITSIEGLLYLRDTNIAYPAATPANATPVTGQVRASDCSGTASSKGRYQVPLVGTTAATALPPVRMTANGYQTSWVTPVVATDSLKDVSVGLYQTKIVRSRTGFVKGVFTMDVGGFMPDTYAQGLFESTYDRIRNMVGANLVAVSDPVWVEAYDVAKATVTMSKTSSIAMLTRDQYIRLVAAAHSRSLAFMMQLGVYPAGSLQNPWSVDAANSAFWDAWFAAYQTIVLEYAAIARDLNIEYLSLGMNNGFMTSVPVAYWQRLVGAVRQAGYTGKILYQAMAGPQSSYTEIDAFNLGRMGTPEEQESKRLEFIKLFDALVIDVYNVAKDRTAPAGISRDEMKESFSWLLNKVSNYPIPIMIQLGTPSVHGGAVNPEYIEPCIVCTSVAPSRQRDLMQQADVYQALAEVINETPTGPGKVMGILSWGYWFTDDYLKWVSSNGNSTEMAYDKSANIRGKPAEAVLNWWFTRW